MAVAFDAVGPSSTGATTATSPLTWTHVCGASATHLLVGVAYDIANDAGKTMSATYNTVAMTSLGVWHTGGATAGFLQVFALASPATGSHSVSVTFTSGAAGVQGGSISFTGSAGLSAVQATVSAGAGANPSAPFTGTISGNMVAGFIASGSAVTPTGSFTSRYNMVTGSGSAGAGFCQGGTIASTGGTVTDTATMGADFWAAALVEVQVAGAAAVPAIPAQPGKTWRRHFHHRGLPFQLTLAAPPATPTANIAGAGTAGVQPIISVSANIAGRGSASASLGPPYIAGLAGGATGYFVDQRGAPRLVWGDAVWALMGNAGRWNSGNWQADFDTFVATRAAQGFTALYGKPMGTTQSGNLDDQGKTFDGLYPFQGGSPSTGVSGANPSTGLTASFWARIDYFLNSCLKQGITVFFNAIGYDSDFSAGPGPLFGKSTTEFTAYGTALGTRYAGQPNLVWELADDYFGENDSLITAFMSGVRGAGDTHVVSIENMPESTSRFTVDTSPAALSWGTSNAQYNFCYSYNCEYYAVEQAYGESSPIPVIQGDGYFYQGSSSYFSSFDRGFRQAAWWSLASAARGKIHGSESIWQWTTTALASSSTDWFYVNNALAIRTVVESLTDWQKLLPDTASALVTGGRGTRCSPRASGGSGGQYEPAFTNAYVAASYTPSGSLALLYLPVHTTITIDQTKLAAGYTAAWVDPVTGAATSTTAGATYNSTAQGSNSQGDPDWVLVLTGPAGAPVNAGASIAGSGTAGARPTIGTGDTLSGGGTAGGGGTVGAPGQLAGNGAAAAGPIIGTLGRLAGAGADGATPTIRASGALAGTGADGAQPTIGAGSSASGSGTAGGGESNQASGSVAGTGLASPVVPIISVSAAIAGTGFAGSDYTVIGGAKQATAAIAGVGTAGATPTIGAPGSDSSSGVAGAQPTIGAGASSAGTGGTGGQGGLAAAGSVAGTGSAQAGPVIGVLTVTAGAGTAGAQPIISVAAAIAGSGAIGLVIPRIGVSDTLTGSGQVSGGGQIGTPGQLAGQGTAGAQPIISVTDTLAGTGTAGAVGANSAFIAGVGVAGAQPTIGAGSAVTGAGSAQGGTSSLAAGSVAGVGIAGPVQPIISVSATVTGSGSCSSGSSSAQSPVAAVAGAGSATARPTILAGCSAAGTGTAVSDWSVGFIIFFPTAAIAGAGSMSLVTPILSAQARLAALGQLTALTQARESAVLAGLGSATGTTTQHAPNVKGSSTSSVTDVREGTLTPAFSRHVGSGSTADVREGTVGAAVSNRASSGGVTDVREGAGSVS